MLILIFSDIQNLQEVVLAFKNVQMVKLNVPTTQ